MDPVSIAGLVLTCVSIIQGFSSVARRIKSIYKVYKNAPRWVRHLCRDLEEWNNLIGEVKKFLTKGELLDKAVRAQLSAYLDDINDLPEEADQLIDAYEDGKFLKRDDFIDLKTKFQEERARLHIWMDLVHLKTTKRSGGKINKIAKDTTETRQTVERIWNEVKQLQARSKGLLRPDFNQSLTDLGQLADDELDETHTQKGGHKIIKMKGKQAAQTTSSNHASGVQPETSCPIYIDSGTQTELPRSIKTKTPPPLSQFPPEIDLDKLPSPSDFPLWVNGVPITVRGSSPQTNGGISPDNCPRSPLREQLERIMKMLEIPVSEEVLSTWNEIEEKIKKRQKSKEGGII